MKKVLITGASGFFGKSVVADLEKKEEAAEYFCTYHTHPVEMKDKRFHWIRVNLLEKAMCLQMIKDIHPTHCMHLAWHVPPQTFWEAGENLDWLVASVWLFRAFCEHGGKVFIGAGTLAEYDWESGILDENNTPVQPRTLYGQCKKSLYDIIRAFKKQHFPTLSLIWPRIGYFFGLDEPKEKLISKLIDHIKHDLPINLASREFKRPYAHVKYLGRALANMIKNTHTAAEDVVCNLSASEGYALSDVVTFIGRQLGKVPTKINYDAYPARPVACRVKNEILKTLMGVEIPDNFFNDLRSVIT